MQFVGTVSKGLYCSGCTKPWAPEDATQCSKCESIVCAACVSSPSCKCGVAFTTLPRLVKQLAENAKVSCPNKDNGCDWTGTRSEFATTHKCTKPQKLAASRPNYAYIEESQIPQELQCPLCHTPFIDPVQLPCEHVFCRSCITDTLTIKPECPCDRQAATFSQLTTAPKMVVTMCEDLPVFCMYKANKCDWTGPRSHVAKHIKEECKKVSTTTTTAVGGATAHMTLETLTEFPSIHVTPGDAPHEIYALAHMVAPRLKDLNERKKPLSISAVIDVSGSMSGAKLKMAQDSLRFMIDELSDRDELGIIAFHTEIAETIVLTKMDEQGKARARAAVDTLRALSRTNLSGGLFAGMDQVQHLPFAAAAPAPISCRRGSFPVRERASKSSVRTPSPPPAPVTTVTPYGACPDTCRAVILFTDGIANGGITDESQLKETLQGKLQHPGTKDMVLHTFGFGADHNARMLQSLAEIASGSYYFVQDVATMKESFADCLGGLLSTVAQNIKLSIMPASGFKIDRVLTSFKQSPPDAKTGIITVQIKDLYSSEKRDVLVKLTPTAPLTASPKAITMVTFSVKYDSLLSGTTDTVDTGCTIIASEEKSTAKPNQTVREQRTRIEATEAMQEARARADAGDAKGAQLFMKAKRCEMKQQCQQSEYVDAMLDDMEEVEQAMDNDAEWMNQGSKAMAAVQSCHAQQRMNRASESKQSLGYDNEWKHAMRSKSRKQ